MRKLLSTLTVCLMTLSLQNLSAAWMEDSVLDVGVGYRTDSIEFRSKIGFDAASSLSDGVSESLLTDSVFDNIHEKDKFRSLNMWQISAYGKTTFCEGVYLRGSADYARIVDGNLKTHYSFGSTSSSPSEVVTTDEVVVSGEGDESSSFVDNTIKLRADADSGYAYDLSAGIGYEWSFCCDQFKIAPLVGWSYNVQDIKAKRFRFGNASSSFSSSSSESFVVEEISSSSDIESSSSTFVESSSSSSSSQSSHIRSNSRVRWNGPWVGVDMVYNVDCDWTLFGGFEWHWARVQSKFRTRLDLANNENNQTSFHFDNHFHSRATGAVFNLGTAYRFDECWSAGVQGAYTIMNGRKGDKDEGTDSKLTHTRWRSFNIEAIVAFHF